MFWFISGGIVGAVAIQRLLQGKETKTDTIISIRGDAPTAPSYVRTFKLYSPTFAPGRPIPAIYTCEGPDIHPPLSIRGVPRGTRSLALIMDDPDSIAPPVFDHWLIWNIPPQTLSISESEIPPGAVQGKNSLKNNHYNGPCTPNDTHRYRFRLYALDTMLDLAEGTRKQELKATMKGHILAITEMVAVYSANENTQDKLTDAMLEAAGKQ